MDHVLSRRTLTFLAVTFGYSWSLALGVHLNGGFGALGGYLQGFLLLYMVGPALGALVGVTLYDKESRRRALGFGSPRWRYFAWAWIAPLLIVAAALFITLAVPGYTLSDPVASQIDIVKGLPESTMSDADKEQALIRLGTPGLAWVLGLSAVVLGPLVNAIVSLSEELGWRGCLWYVFAGTGFWTASFMIGLIWGVWHMPIIWLGHNYPSAPVAGSIAFVGLCVLLSPFYSWIRARSGSVWGASLAHGTFNAVAGYGLLCQTPMDMPWSGVLGIGGFMAAALSALVILWVWQRAQTSGAYRSSEW